MTTFLSRESARDALVSLFTANNSWQSVYGYFPAIRVWLGASPVLIIRARGTRQSMAGFNTNPAAYRMVLTSMVLASSPTDSGITSQAAEDKLDELDKVMRQVVRDNVQNVNWNNLEFEDGFSQVDDLILEGHTYIVESRGIIVHLQNGAV